MPEIPTGRPLAATLNAVFRRLRAEVAAQLAAGRAPDLARWQAVLAEAARPFFERWYMEGGRAERRRLAGKGVLSLMRGGRSGVWVELAVRPLVKDVQGGAFDLFNPRVREAIDRALFAFADSTLATITGEVNDALAELRSSLYAGLEAGEAQQQLSARVGAIFGDPLRAHRIAASEASRAVHAGQVLAARESGVAAGFRWLASADACPLCQALDGKEVAPGEAFVVDGAGPYARVEHPPRHPFCMCTLETVV